MIGNALRVEIERFAVDRIRKSGLFRMAEDGRVGRACIRAYLENIHYLISHTPQCLQLAVDRSREKGLPEVARFFERKLAEETGHDVWAERDIASVSDSGAVRVPQVTDAMRDLVSFILATIEREPVLYLSYVLFAEYFTVVIGPEWVRLLDERCGIPRGSMTVIANHIELDVDHVEHALDEIDDLVGDPALLPAMREVLRESMARFEQFCVELADAYEGHDEQRRAVDSAHVSAA